VTVLRELLDLGLVVARVLGPRGSCRLDLSFLIQLLLKTLVLLTHPLPRGAPLYLYYFFRDLTMGASIFFSARSLAVSKFVVPELFFQPNPTRAPKTYSVRRESRYMLFFPMSNIRLELTGRDSSRTDAVCHWGSDLEESHF
jgi:hypothetical protein